MAKFRKKPIEVEVIPVSVAIKYAATSCSNLPDWLRDKYDKGQIYFGPNFILISTLEGKIRGDWDDLIINGVKGEIYPCKPDVFAATYERVQE